MSGKSELSPSVPTCVTSLSPSAGPGLSRVLLYVADPRHLEVAPQNDTSGDRDGFKHADCPQIESIQALASVGSEKRTFANNVPPASFAESHHISNIEVNNHNTYREVEMTTVCNPAMPSYIYRAGVAPDESASILDSVSYRSRADGTYHYPIGDAATEQREQLFHSTVTNLNESATIPKLIPSNCDNFNTISANVIPTNDTLSANCGSSDRAEPPTMDQSTNSMNSNVMLLSNGVPTNFHNSHMTGHNNLQINQNQIAYNQHSVHRINDASHPYDFHQSENNGAYQPNHQYITADQQMDSVANVCAADGQEDSVREAPLTLGGRSDASSRRQCSLPPSEGEIVIVNNVPHHFVRTPEGLMLTVLAQPSQQAREASSVNDHDCKSDVQNVRDKVYSGMCDNAVRSDGNVNGNGSQVGAGNMVSEPFPLCHEPSFSVVVPFGWRRIINGSMVFYISPSGAILGGMDQLREYLQTAGTCKCGLECPLLAEQAFNFDPKVPSKPYEMQSESTRDLTKLCNHKRKLLAMVSSSLSHQPAASAPFDNTRKAPDTPNSKKKKKKATPYSGVSVSQLLAQKEKLQQQQQQYGHVQQNPPGDRTWHGENVADPNRTASPTVPLMRTNSQSSPSVNSHSPVVSTQASLVPTTMVHTVATRDNITFSTTNEPLANKQTIGSHFITVNGGMLFNGPDNQQKMTQNNPIVKNETSINNVYNNLSNSNAQTNNMINHVIGPNGQIIGIQTNVPRNTNVINNTIDGKGYFSNISTGTLVPNKSEKTLSNNAGQSPLSDEKQYSTVFQNVGSQSIATSTNSQSNGENIVQNSPHSGQMTNVLIGPNPQSLTPEVVQRINQQQQMFIQQNQKQIEMAMKGIRTQFIPNNQLNTINKPKANTTNQPVHQGQLIIQNGTVMMANQQAKTPSWQIGKLNEPQNIPLQNHQKVNSNMKPFIQQQDGQMLCQNVVVQMPLQQNAPANYATNHFGNQGQLVNQNVYSRVPPFQQHCMQPVWNEEVCKKKKTSKSSKKTRQANIDNAPTVGNHCPNVNITHMGQNRNGYNVVNLHSKNPSFMEDPSGYLAQQTALLNSTISRQIEVNSNLSNNNAHMNDANNPHMNNTFNDSNAMVSHKNQNVKSNSNMNDIQQNAQRNQNFSTNRPPSQYHTPDSSNQNDKVMDLHQQNQYNSNHCKGCLMSMNNGSKRITANSENQMKSDNTDGTVRINSPYVTKMGPYTSTCKSDSSSQPGTPSSSNIEDNPVTSSTVYDRPGYSYNQGFSDPRGPIQGGAISTSNGSPVETFQLPEPSPTPSNSSRNTDTPQSNNSGSANLSSGSFTVPSPAPSNHGSSRDSNPATPTPVQNNFNGSYSSPGPPNHQPNNNQAHIAFNSNMNVLSLNAHQNKHQVEGDNMQPLVMQNSVNPVRTIQVSSQNGNQICNFGDEKKPTQNHEVNIFPQKFPCTMNSHFGLHSSNSNNIGIITTMASGHTVIRDTITSVLAGKAQTATTSITAGSNLQYGRLAVNVNQFSSQNEMSNNMTSSSMPSNYPMHVAGTIAHTIISKSPLEMVQSIVSSIKSSQPSSSTVSSPQHNIPNVKANNGTSQNIATPQILMSSNGQLVVTGSGQGQVMPPPPPKGQVISPLPSLAASNLVSNTTGTAPQVLPAGVQQVINQPTVLVNTMSAPFVIQPQMIPVDGQMISQNTVLPQLMTNGMISQGQPTLDMHSPGQPKTVMQSLQRGALLSPEAGKKKSKKKKVQNQQPVGMLQLATQHSPGSVILQQGTQQSTQQFSPQSFQVSPNQNMQPTPVLQALTIVPGKAGTPAHILMNGQPTAGNFSSQQIITNSQPPQQINLLQPMNLLNGTTSMVQNFPTFQQFIVPGLGSMVMTADGTLIQDPSGMPVQLQIQNVNGQNVLTPVQNQGILTAGNTGMVIRTPTGHSKIVQAQHSPGTQFLSPNSQIVMNNTGFSGQLSPLIANVSPNQSMTFSTSPQQVRSSNVSQDFIQCNQMGQTLMVPVQPHQMPVTSNATQGNTTFVQQNTTIVQQQTTMVSNNQAQFQAQNLNGAGNIIANAGASTLSIDPAMLLNQNGKQINCSNKQKNQAHIHNQAGQQILSQNFADASDAKKLMQYPQIVNQYNVKTEQEVLHHSSTHNVNLSGQQIICTTPQNMNSQAHSFMLNNFNERHSVSTQTLLNQQQNSIDKSPPRSGGYQQVSGSSPPDTTTHSPLGPLDGNSSSPSLPVNRSTYTHGNHADTTTKSPEPNDVNTSAMVQCVSSSEPDCDKELSHWQSPHSEFIAGDTKFLQTQLPDKQCYNMEASNMQFNHQNVPSIASPACQQNVSMMQMNYYHRNSVKRKSNEYADSVKYGSEKVMRLSAEMSHSNVAELGSYKNRLYPSGYEEKAQEMQVKDMFQDSQRNVSKMDMTNLRPQNMHLVHGNEPKAFASEPEASETGDQFERGDLVWGPAKGYPAWPGKLMSKHDSDEGHGTKALVRWFGGDRSLTLVDAAALKTLSEGLEAHHAARTKCRKSRKLNAQLEKAIQEAMAELDKMSEGGKYKLRRKNVDSQVGKLVQNKAGGNKSAGVASQQCGSYPANNNNNNIIKAKHASGTKNLAGANARIVPVKIAPHPAGQPTTEVTGRLRSSQQR